jgi:glycosyltransferase involved in cell wall biosynthesis
MTHKLRIMQICGAPDAGGAQAFFLRLCRALHRHETVELLPVVRRKSWLAERLEAESLPHLTLGFGGKLDLLTRPRLAQAMRRFRPHVAQGWMNRASRFLPRGTTCTIGRLGGYYDLKYYRGIDHLIGNTQDICRYLREQGWPADRTHYIPNFVDLPAGGFKTEGETVRRRHGIPAEAPVLLFAGRLHPVKGADTLLMAMAQLPADIHLLLAGDGGEEQRLRQLAADCGLNERVHFLGWINDITPLCAAADIFVVPSRSEPLGNVVLEAWAHALPLVSSAAEGPCQLVTPRHDGLLVPIDDATAFASALREVLSNRELAMTLAANGLETLHARFSEKAVLGQYLDLYQRLQENDTCAA